MNRKSSVQIPSRSSSASWSSFAPIRFRDLLGAGGDQDENANCLELQRQPPRKVDFLKRLCYENRSVLAVPEDCQRYRASHRQITQIPTGRLLLPGGVEGSRWSSPTRRKYYRKTRTAALLHSGLQHNPH